MTIGRLTLTGHPGADEWGAYVTGWRVETHAGDVAVIVDWERPNAAGPDTEGTMVVRLSAREAMALTDEARRKAVREGWRDDAPARGRRPRAVR